MKTLSNEELQHSIDATARLIQGDNSIRDRILTVHLENLTDEQRKRATDELELEPLDRVGFDARVRGQDGPEWVEWSGGECPIPDSRAVEVKFRNGRIENDKSPRIWRWTNEGLDLDIIAYRVLADKEQSK